jgi:outer membrane receptor for ferrienterochelin and colicin
LKLLYIILFSLFTQVIVSQATLKGKVISFETGESIPNVDIIENNSKKWTLTDENGEFQLTLNTTIPAVITVKILGKEAQNLTIIPQDFSRRLLISLKDANLRLNEVVVSSQKGKNYSEIVIGNEAINQVQAFSINEVLEQLPGQAMTNLDLNEFKPIVFRTSRPMININDEGFGNKSFGTAVVVDGIPLSNNENMQSYGAGTSSLPFSPNYLGYGDSTGAYDSNGYFSNANFGTDLRQLPTNNIEKVEVVEGIPSAKYGDLTSGLIKIEQKAGKTPYQVYTSLRDGATEYGFSKGFRLSERAGAINFSISNLESDSNPREGFTKYNRTTSNLIWSWNNKKKNIKNSVTLSYAFNDDDVNYDEENADQKKVRNEKKDFSFADRFKWNFDEGSFFDNMDINFNFTYTKQLSFESKLVNGGGNVVGTSTTEGVYYGSYTPISYTSIKAVEGIPLSSYFSTDLYKTFTTGDWKHNVSIGTSFRMSDNKGRGRLGSPETMIKNYPDQGFRPYNFGDNVRAEFQASLYAEDNITKQWNTNEFNVSTGLRYDNMYGTSLIAPRINSYFSGEKYKIRGGFGLTSKAPSLNQIYTGSRYYDATLADVRLPGYYNVNVVQTFVDYADNKDLKPSKSIRSELGFDYKLPFGTINFTGYYNKLYDGITSEGIPLKREMAQLNILYDDPNPPTYEIAGYQTTYFQLSKLVNKLESTDKGVEMFLNIKKMPIHNITLDIQGSYVETETWNGSDTFLRSTDVSSEEKYGVYGAYTHYYKQFRLGANLNYHLPKIGLIISVRSEHFITDHNYYTQNNFPYAYLDADLNKVLIPEADRTNTTLYGHIIRNGNPYDRNTDKVYNNFHLRVSKDFLNGFKFSFYASNFLDLKPTGYYIYNGAYEKKVNLYFVQLSFGTRIEYQF